MPASIHALASQRVSNRTTRPAADTAVAMVVVFSLAAACGLVGCGSDPEHPVADATAAPAPVEPTGAVTSTVVSGPLPTVDVSVVDFAELASLLPPLTATSASANHVIELRLRTLTVRVDGTQLCLGGGEGSGTPDSCADLTSRPAVLVYSDRAATPVYAVLTDSQVAVTFLGASGASLDCFGESVSRIGPLMVWWCEEQFAPTLRFELASGPRYEVVIG